MLNVRKNFKVIKSAMLTVFQKPRYILFAGVLFALIFFAYIFLNNIPLFSSVLKINPSFDLFSRVFSNVISTIIDIGGILQFSAIVLVAILGAINIAMIAYKMNSIKSSNGNEGLSSFSGLFAGALASACPACASSLLSILGVSGGLALFPLRGLEFSITAAALLLISIYFVSKSLVECGVCKL